MLSLIVVVLGGKARGIALEYHVRPGRLERSLLCIDVTDIVSETDGVIWLATNREYISL